MLKVIVDRQKWLRGGNSILLDHDGKMCCLGFVCKKVGFEDETIKGVSDPQELYNNSLDYNDELDENNIESNVTELVKMRLGEEVKLLKHSHNTSECEQLITINDSRDIDDHAREAQLIEVGRKAGIEFEFVN